MRSNSEAFAEVKLKKKNQVTIPSSMIPKGTERFRLTKNREGYLVLIPMASVPVDQQWFWTPRWQEGERKVDEDIEAGRVKKFDNVEDLIQDLRRKREPKQSSRKK